MVELLHEMNHINKNSHNYLENDSNQSLDIKSYKCAIEGCGKSFSSLSNLSRHSLIHSGERPYKCDICNKGFNQQGNLKKHLKSHENAHLRWNRNTTDKPFKCTYCTRSFTVKSSLQNHMLSHQQVPSSITSQSDYNQLIPMENNKPVSITNNIVSRCLHGGCTKLFDSQKDLRSHLFGHAPGLAAEFKVMSQTILNLISMIENWDIKTPAEKTQDKDYVSSLKVCLQTYPLLVDSVEPPTNQLDSKYQIEDDTTNTNSSIYQSSSESTISSDYQQSPLNFTNEKPTQQLYNTVLDNDDLLFQFEDNDEDLDLFESILDPDYHSNIIPSQLSSDATCLECKGSNTKSITYNNLPPPLQAASKEIFDGWKQHMIIPNLDDAISLESKKRRMIN